MKRIFSFLVVTSFLYAQIPGPLAKEHARHSEEWVKNGIIYEIYPRAFSKEGTFARIEQKIPELKKLGVTILWLMPIHPVGVKDRKGTLGSPYSIKDYYGINPEYGTLQDFKSLVRTVHKNGLKIVIDLVANHTSWDSKMFTEHPDWFVKDSTGKFVPPVPDWSDVVKLDYSNNEVRRYMIEMMKYWVRDIGIDGYRCDVAEMVPTDFWNEARTALDSIKPVMMLSEGMAPEHHLKAFDLTYSWNFYHTMAEIIKGDKPAGEMDSILAQEALAYPKGSLRMRFSSNHDENAWDNSDVVKFGEAGAKLAAVLTNTFPGVPLLYNGQEAGNETKLGLFEKFEIDWTKGTEWREFYTKLFSIRKRNSSLANGTYTPVHNNRSDAVYTFLRSNDGNTVLAAFNFDGGEKTAHIELPGKYSGKTFLNAFTGKMVSEQNVVSLVLPPFGYRIFVLQ